MSKGIKFKDNIYLDSSSVIHNRKQLDSILDGIKPFNLLNNSLQSNSTSTLIDNYSNYDILACRVGIGSMTTEGCWVLLFPRIREVQSQWNICIYTSYYAYGVIKIKNNNQIELVISAIKGWSNDNVYLTEVYGIKLSK